MRHAVLLAALVGALLLPAVSVMLPTFSPLAIPGDLSSGERRASNLVSDPAMRDSHPDVSEALPPSSPRASTSSPRARTASQSTVILAAWFLGTALLSLRIALDLAAA